MKSMGYVSRKYRESNELRTNALFLQNCIINGLTRFLCFHALQHNEPMLRFSVHEQRATRT